MSAPCRPGRRPEMPALLRRPACPGARSCQGRSSLDRACAPAEYGSYQEARTGKISQVKVSTLSGEPRDRYLEAAVLDEVGHGRCRNGASDKYAGGQRCASGTVVNERPPDRSPIVLREYPRRRLLVSSWRTCRPESRYELITGTGRWSVTTARGRRADPPPTAEPAQSNRRSPPRGPDPISHGRRRPRGAYRGRSATS